MSKKIQESDIFQGSLFGKTIAEAKMLIEVMKDLKKEINDTGKTMSEKVAKNTAESSEEIEELNKDTQELIKTKESLNKVQKEEIRQNQRILALEKEEIKTTKQLSETSAKLAQVNIKVNQRLQRRKVELQEATKAAKQQARESLGLVGAYERESRRLNDLRKRYKNLAVQNKENTKEGQRLLKNITKLDKRLKDVDKTVGQSQRNVGNYNEAFVELQNSTGIFSRELSILQGGLKTVRALFRSNTTAVQSNKNATEGLTVAQKAFNLASNGGVKSLKLLKGALIGSGIGAAVVALGSLVSFFSATQKGANLLDRGLAALSTTFEVLRDRASDIGSALISVATGDISEGLDQLKNAFSGIGDEISEEVKQVDDLTVAIQKLDVELAQFVITRARLRKDIDAARLAAEDETLEIDKRIKSLRKAIELEEVIANERIKNLKQEAFAAVFGGKNAETRAKAEQLINDVLLGRRQLEIENLGFAESNIDDLNEASEIFANILSAQSEQFKRQKSEQTRLNALLKQQTSENEKNAKGLGLIEELQKKITETQQQRNKATNEGEIKALNEEIKSLQDELRRLQELGNVGKKNEVGLIQVLNNELKELKKSRQEATSKEEILAITESINAKEEEVRIVESLNTQTKRQIEAEKELSKIRQEREIDAIDIGIDVEDIGGEEGNFDERIENVKKRQDLELKLAKEKRDEELEDLTLTEAEKNVIIEQSLKEQEDIIRKGNDDIESINNERYKQELKAAEQNAADRKEVEAALFSFLGNQLESYYKRKFDLIQKDLDSSVEAENRLLEAQQEGVQFSEESVAEERRRQAELEQEQLRLEEQQARRELVLASLQAYRANDGNLSKTFTDIIALREFANNIPLFYDGTEDTGAGGNVDNKGGFHAILHPHERVLTAAQNEVIGDLSNDDLTSVAQMYNTGGFINNEIKIPDYGEKLEDLKNEIKMLPKRMPVPEFRYDQVNKMIIDTVKYPGKTVNKKYKANRLF